MNEYPALVQLGALTAAFCAGYLKGRIAHAKEQSADVAQPVMEPRHDEFEVMSETLRTRLLTNRVISSEWARSNYTAAATLIRPESLSIVRALLASPFPLSYLQIDPGGRMLRTTFSRYVRQLIEAGVVVARVSEHPIPIKYEVSPKHHETLMELLAVADRTGSR